MDMRLGHEKLDVYRLSIEAAGATRFATSLWPTGAARMTSIPIPIAIWRGRHDEERGFTREGK